MDWTTLLTAITSSFGLSTAGAYWLGKSLLTHRLAGALEEKKSELTKQLELQKTLASQDLERLKDSLQFEQSKAKSAIDADIRKQVEIQLGEITAQRQYEYEAKRRLYVAVGPLRFQLLLACRDLVGRIQAIGLKEQYEFNLNEYYCQSTIYRILKPIALTALIEEQMTLSDFSVDREAIDLLRFRKSVTRIYSGDELVANHPNVAWSRQVEHLFADSLSSVIQPLIERSDERNARVLRFDEFRQKIIEDGWDAFAPLHHLFDQFEVTRKPVLWLRLVSYAHVCNALVTRQGRAYGFEEEAIDTKELLLRSHDSFTKSKVNELLQKIKALEILPL
jgi:hypothetical protein